MNKTQDSLKVLLLMVTFIGIFLMPMVSAQQMDPPIQMPFPEIEITAIEFSGTDVIEGQEVTISVTIENKNSTMVVDNITVSLYLDNELMQNFTDIDLGGAESATFDHVWDSESGIHNVSAMLFINEVPLMDSLISEELEIDLGDVGTILISLLVIVLAVLVIAALPSIFAMGRR